MNNHLLKRWFGTVDLREEKKNMFKWVNAKLGVAILVAIVIIFAIVVFFHINTLIACRTN